MKIVLGAYNDSPHDFHRKWIDDTWILSDINPHSENMQRIDARDIPYKEVEALYASHIVEHIAIADLPGMFSHWHAALASKGWVVINVPDMEWVSEEIQRLERGEAPRSAYFTTKKEIMHIIYGAQDTQYDEHKSGFTKSLLEEYLTEAGFVNVTVERVYEAHDMGCLIARAEKS